MPTEMPEMTESTLNSWNRFYFYTYPMLADISIVISRVLLYLAGAWFLYRGI